MKKTFFFIASLTIFFCSCYYDKEEKLYPNLIPNTCDTVNVNYQKHIKPLMDQYCVTCHGKNASGGVNLSTYDLTKSYAAKIYGTLNHDSGFKPMPKNSGKLDNCKIIMVRKWIETGMSN